MYVVSQDRPFSDAGPYRLSESDKVLCLKEGLACETTIYAGATC